MNAAKPLGLVVVALLATACSAQPAPAPSTATPAPTSSSASPSASPTTPPPQPVPAPVSPGTARGELLFVQRAEDASLVAGGVPIRLTLARTQNTATWFTAPPARESGTVTTEEMMLSLGWRPSDTGRTAALPKPFPNGLLSTGQGDLAVVIQKANVRSDGTLVLDVQPIGREVDTVESFGPLSLSIDGAPGVLVLERDVTQDLKTRVIVSGRDNHQAFVQIVGYEGSIIESVFMAGDRNHVDYLGDISIGNTQLTDVVLDFRAPRKLEPGSVILSGTLTDHGTTGPLTQVVARWSLPVAD